MPYSVESFTEVVEEGNLRLLEKIIVSGLQHQLVLLRDHIYLVSKDSDGPVAI